MLSTKTKTSCQMFMGQIARTIRSKKKEKKKENIRKTNKNMKLTIRFSVCSFQPCRNGNGVCRDPAFLLLRQSCVCWCRRLIQNLNIAKEQQRLQALLLLL